MNKSTFTWKKRLSKTDVGEAKTNQSGVYIFANQMKLFVDETHLEKERHEETITVLLPFNEEEEWKFQWYKSKRDNGTIKKELHLTGCWNFFQRIGISSGDELVLKKLSAGTFEFVATDNFDRKIIENHLTGKIEDSSLFQHSVEKGRSIELHAMRVAKEYYEEMGYKITDTSANKPYDLLCEKDEEKEFVEVKGTTGAGESVILTKNEVKHARKEENSTLFIVRKIDIHFAEGRWVTSNGEVKRKEKWKPEDSHLECLSYKYSLQ